MSTSNDRTEILRMVESRQISAAEGLRLLAALDQSQPAPKPEPVPEPAAANTQASPAAPRWLRIRVTNLATHTPKVNVNVPLGLVNMGLRIGRHYSPELSALDWDKVLEQVQQGADGKLVEVEHLIDNERVEVFVE